MTYFCIFLIDRVIDLFSVGISGFRQLVIRGDTSTGFYQSVGVFANGTLQLANNHCYFNKINFPFSSTTDGLTGYEKKTSTLLHCAGTLVSDSVWEFTKKSS